MPFSHAFCHEVLVTGTATPSTPHPTALSLPLIPTHHPAHPNLLVSSPYPSPLILYKLAFSCWNLYIREPSSCYAIPTSCAHRKVRQFAVTDVCMIFVYLFWKRGLVLWAHGDRLTRMDEDAEGLED